MISWNHFLCFALPALLLWAAGAWAAWRNRRMLAKTLTFVGLAVFYAFIAALWISLERPPLQTMGETRLWYSAFLPLAGVIIYIRYGYKWILSFSTLLALVFICINVFKPEIHNKTLMPALQSPWFAPHVIIYMFCYALMGAAVLMAVAMLVSKKIGEKGEQWMKAIDNLVFVGLSFMTIGMLFGALWAKEAWGHYWAWDPKETWAAATWLLYLGYVHLRQAYPLNRKLALALLVFAFCCLQMCWWGINYLPAAQANSVHTYAME